MVRFVVRAAAALVLVAGLGGCIDWEWQSAGTEAFTLSSQQLATVQRAEIRVQRGSVLVEGEARADAVADVHYLGRVWSGKGKCGGKGHGGYDDDDLDEVLDDAWVDVRVEQGTLYLLAEADDDARTDLHVRLPAELDVHVEVRRGDATVEGIQGDVSYGGVAGFDFRGDG